MCKSTPDRWFPPPTGFYKANFAGVLLPEENAIGIGVVVRNEKVEFMAGLSLKMYGPLDAEYIQVSAAMEATKFVGECGFFDIIVEGDAANIINALVEGKRDMFAKHGYLFEDVYRNLGDLCRLGGFFHIGEPGNRVAHELARHARFVSEASDNYLAWLEDPPEFLEPSLAVDECSSAVQSNADQKDEKAGANS
ncbi:hypothetical protein RJ639_029310 [Escallonia herrerae]|uniref:RNase H type-1 domain-containing protein n=1 Tax=Escallonia herrerae TaxID=1293975 RepID=A0AA88XGV2_9ASTE|nr:hypothetical protein RJ639_029310 [Escallonia herrerae]